MSAGGDDPHRAAARVSVIASIGYCAALAGPPTIGVLGSHFTVLRGLVVIAALVGVAALIAGAVRPLPVAHRAAPPRASTEQAVIRPGGGSGPRP